MTQPGADGGWSGRLDRRITCYKLLNPSKLVIADQHGFFTVVNFSETHRVLSGNGTAEGNEQGIGVRGVMVKPWGAIEQLLLAVGSDPERLNAIVQESGLDPTVDVKPGVLGPRMRAAQGDQSNTEFLDELVPRLDPFDIVIIAPHGFGLDLVEISRERTVGHDGQLYLELLKKVLTNVIYQDISHDVYQAYKGRNGLKDYNPAARAEGRDWPTVAHTMVGLQRLDNVQMCIDHVLADGIPGDFIETGVWRGGVCIFMRAVREAYGCIDRAVWVADSFQGIPETTREGHPLDQELALHRANDVLAVPMQVVQENFKRYGLLDDQVKFLPGWFKDSLPKAPIDRLAVLRLDGDLYESTTDALENLYPKLSTGGFVIVDDYVIPGCRDAVHDFRREHNVEDPIQAIDHSSVYWRRTA